MSLPDRMLPAVSSREVAEEVARDFSVRLLELGIRAFVAYDHVGLAFIVSCERHGLRRLDASKANWSDRDRPCSADGWSEALDVSWPNQWQALR